MRWVIALIAVGLSTAVADSESARAHYEKGLAAYALGHYREAAIEYESAFELKPDPALLYNAAQAHRLAGEKERALLLYENYLRLFPHRPNEKDVHRYIQMLRSAIEGDARAKSTPPTEPLIPSPAPQTAEARVTPPAALAPPPGPPPRARSDRKKTPAWVWGVVGATAGVVVIGAVVGLSIGLSGTQYPNAATTVTLR
jgi:tetratricopeptide (TPR) repeat protein